MPSRFEQWATPIGGLRIIGRRPVGDERGSFCRFYCSQEFAALGIEGSIAQINHTVTRLQGTVRGLHFQYPPFAETKIVTCLRGEIFDVAVDLRPESPTFLQWHGERLSEQNRRSLVVPEGFGHGFQALTDDCEILYLVSQTYHPAAEGALHPADPRVGVKWPLEITCLSERDRSHPFITPDFQGVVLPRR